uniref:Glutathione S-transferase n=1 Tax=Curvibacter symbiont subsp. Hydra magnipapillata TaxID=667019 RepID=C9YBN8_CURXX|nr:hypothetical protein Csp_A15390 [Curvibacter putative symbiont of Hydra magnipapillata]
MAAPPPRQDPRTMPDLSSFPITQRWPASHPGRLQLYAVPTPNGFNVLIMLEEAGRGIRARCPTRRLSHGVLQ